MEHKEIDTELADLDEKVDRCRALYEQYFIGLEKLEPLIPRKDIDRRIYGLRKIQIRNTAQRFRFQSLVQRYNSMQQYWGRVVREIEAGTYRRDLMKAAARFGADEAMTAVGKKRAERFKKLLEEQDKRKKEKKRVFELDENDVNWSEEDYDAPTPPPQAAPAAAPVYQLTPEGLPLVGDYGQAPAAQPDPAAGFSHAVVHGANAWNQPAAAQPHAQPPPHPGYAQPAGPVGYPPPPPANAGPPVHVPPQPPPPPQRPLQQPTAAQSPAGQAAPEAQPKKGAGGLRWGGGPRKTADPEATKRRLAELAAKVGAEPPPDKPPPLMQGPLELEISSRPPPKPAPPVPPAAAPRTTANEAAAGRKPLLSSPLDVDLGAGAEKPRKPLMSSPLGIELGPESPPSGEPAAQPKAPNPQPAPAAKAAVGDGSAGARPALGPPPKPSTAGKAEEMRAAAAAKAEKRELDDGRMRDIYNNYVKSKRTTNESTAGITYEKLADSLRVQAEKLKRKHPGRRVDYQVVVKDGKTLLKPIVK